MWRRLLSPLRPTYGGVLLYLPSMHYGLEVSSLLEVPPALARAARREVSALPMLTATPLPPPSLVLR